MVWQIAIDGPAGAGKSTIAKILAKNLNFEYLDTGAMYRAATVKALRLGIDLFDESKYDFIISTTIDFINGDIYLDGENVTSLIRTLEVSNNVSTVCKYKIVRDKMVELQRKISNSKNIVMDGRDIGTVVLPNANLKIFLTATPEVRAMRRMLERQENGTNTQTLEETIKEISDRDYRDSHREISPLAQAHDATVIDSSQLSINEVVERITSLVRERGCNMEDVKQVNEVAEETAKEEKVAEEATVETNEVATQEAPVESTDEAQKPEELRELQLVEGVVIDQIESKPEYTDKDGNVKKAKEAKILFQLSNGQEGYLLMKDAAGITDEEDLFYNFEIDQTKQLIVKKIYPDGGKVLLSTVLLEKRENLKKYQEVIDNHGTIDAKVLKNINVGLILDHEGYSCLLPTSQIDPKEDMETIIGKVITVSPIRVDYNRIRLIVSEKVATAIKERAEKEAFIATVKVGNVYEGTVKNIESYGAFVELEKGVEGLLHISEIEHNRIVKVEKVLKTGDKVKVQVIKVEDGHIGLSRKALIPNYWQDFVDGTEVGKVVKGTVAEINNSGVVINLTDHIQGFLPKSETSWERDSNINELFQVGQELELKVIELDSAKKRIILSAKQLTDNPWEVLKLQPNDEVNCKVIGTIEVGVRLNVEGASGFLPNSNMGDKKEFAPGEEFKAKVRAFDPEKHKLIVTLREETPRPKTNTPKRAPKADTQGNVLKSEDKVSHTLGDFINLDDFK